MAEEHRDAERENFVAAHVQVCKADRCKRYDRAKGQGALHSLEYSRRKCAKSLWRRMQRGQVTNATNN